MLQGRSEAMRDTPDASSSSNKGNTPPSDQQSSTATSRRACLEGAGSTVVATAAVQALGSTPADAAVSAMTAPARTAISLTVNGVSHLVEVEDRWTLVELLRDQLDLTGTKIGCDRSECGSCTVLLNGQPVYACCQLAVWADGADVQTVEGLAHNGQLSPLQQAFIDHNAPQCGFCTPGQLMMATALLNTVPRPDAAQVQQALVGNLCRCSNYNAIVEAVVAAGAQQGGAA
jgi:aerobic-type carbon monoxide dehydrogenase small subunit (CoxS/CutS family)